MSPRAFCPSCGSARIESFLNYDGYLVDYYRCLDCRHVWNVPKGQDGPVHHVTPLPEITSVERPEPSETMQDLVARAERAVARRRKLEDDYLALEIQANRLSRHARRAIINLAQVSHRLVPSKWVSKRVPKNPSARRGVVIDLAGWRHRKFGAA